MNVPDADLTFVKKADAKYNADFTAHDRPGETRSIMVQHPLKINVADMSG